MVKPDTKRITKDIPTNYEQEYNVTMALLREDRAYVDDKGNAKVLDKYDMADIFKKLSSHLKSLQSYRLDVGPLSRVTPGVVKKGFMATPYFGNSESVKGFQKYLKWLQKYLLSKKQNVKDFHRHENFLLKHNYRNGKNYNKEVGVHIDSIV